MDVLSLTAGLACTVSALLVIGLCVPTMRPESDWTIINGIRRPDAFSSDEAWQRLNRFAARRMILWSVPVFVIGGVAFFIPLEARPWLALAFGCAPLLIMGAVVEIARYARRGDSEEAA